MIVNENNCGTASGTEIQNFKGQVGYHAAPSFSVYCVAAAGVGSPQFDLCPPFQCTCGDIVANQRITDIIIDTQMSNDIPRLLCGTNGACHPIKDIFLNPDATKVRHHCLLSLIQLAARKDTALTHSVALNLLLLFLVYATILQVKAGGVFGILITFFILVIASGAFLPQMWTCSRSSD